MVNVMHVNGEYLLTLTTGDQPLFCGVGDLVDGVDDVNSECECKSY